jgi:hypothetical protein
MWFAGIAVGLAVLGGLLVDRRANLRVMGRLALVPALSLCVAAATPAGPGLLLTPLTISGYTQFISEWDPPDVRDAYVAVTFLMAGVLMALWARSKERVPVAYLATAALALVWALLYARTVALGAIMLAPLTAAALSEKLSLATGAPTRRERFSFWAATASSIFLAAVLAPGFAARPGFVPSGVSARLAALPPGTVVFNDYGLGGWLLWRHQQLVPVIDGRAEVYDVAYVDQNLRARAALPGWEATVVQSGARFALMGNETALAAALEQRLHWRPVAEDAGFVLLTAPEPVQGAAPARLAASSQLTGWLR